MNQIPNCGNCKWTKWVSFSILMLGGVPQCSAQGYRNTSDVYNTDLCKELYRNEEKERKDVSEPTKQNSTG